MQELKQRREGEGGERECAEQPRNLAIMRELSGENQGGREGAYPKSRLTACCMDMEEVVVAIRRFDRAFISFWVAGGF